MIREIDIGRQFSKFPAGRRESDGPKSGELFRKQVLLPVFSEPDVTEVVVSLDNAMGYGSSFLEEAFGGLVRDGMSIADIRQRLRLVTDDAALLDEINEYIQDAAFSKSAQK
jgi:hypothetical protein